MNKIGKILCLIVALLALGSMFGGASDVKEEIENNNKGMISLEAPPFVLVSSAVEDTVEAFPEDEAGISAYVNIGQSIDLEEVGKIFDQINETGETHVIGMVPIPNYGGDIHPHLYADTDGWIVAYFTKDENASLMMSWENCNEGDKNTPNITDINTTTLEDAIKNACDAIGVDYTGVEPNINYYVFEFPEADGMMLFVRTRATEGSNYTHVSIPGDYMLFEASYSHYACNYYYSGGAGFNSNLKIDGTQINELSRGDRGTYVSYRRYDGGSTFTVGTPHTIEITYSPEGGYDGGSSGVATVLIYKTA